MSIVFDTEQQSLRAATRQFLETHGDSEAIRALLASSRGLDDQTWIRMANELGLHGLAIPAEFGGADGSAIDQLIVWEELGRALAGSAFYSTIALAANAIQLSGDTSAQKELLPEIADGALIATISFLGPDGDIDRNGDTVQAVESDGQYLLNGRGFFVSDGHIAHKIVVLADSTAGPSLFVVDTAEGNVKAEQLDTLDGTFKQAHLWFDHSPGRLLGTAGTGIEILDRTVDLARLAVAAQQLGGAQQCLDMVVDYAKVRTQFGRKIGSFQAVKHSCADMLTAIEIARSAVYFAAEQAATGGEEFSLAAPMAKALASEAYTFAARQNIQLHGGIGCTWEHDAHLHYRRAHASAVLLGGVDEQRALLADRLGI